MSQLNNEIKKSLWSQFQNGQNYLDRIGLRKKIPKCVDYYEGKQWPEVTKETALLPRPTVNIAKFISKNKKAGVGNTPVKIVFKAEDGSATEILNDFHEYINDELKHKDVDKSALTSAVKKGTYIYHYYWDANKQGADGDQDGGVSVEELDVLNIAFANPSERDEQKQKWIIIASREEVGAIQEITKNEGNDPDLISTDENESAYNEVEQDGTDYVTILTRYFKKGGEVWFEKETKNGVIVQKERRLTPDITEAMKTLYGESEKPKVKSKEDEADTGLQDAKKDKEIKEDKFELYPIVVGSWEERDKSIYGISEVEEQLENQNIINRNLAYYIKARRDVSLGGYMVKPGALDEDETISNSPDQIVVDNTPGNMWGVQALPTRNVPTDNVSFVAEFLGMLRTVTGATEVMSGEVLGKNMSGAAIAQLQSQAQQPLEDYRQRFWAVKEKQALVLMQFYRLFYKTTVFKKKVKQGDQEMVQDVTFDPSTIRGKKIDVVAIAGQGSAYNELSTVNALDNLLNKGVIDAEFYIKALPDKILGNKDDLLKYLREQKQSQIVVLTQQNQQMQEQLVQAAEILTKQDEMVKKASAIVAENKRLNETIINMAIEYQENIGRAKQLYEEAKNDATMFAEEVIKSQQDMQQQPQAVKKGNKA